MSEPLAFAIIAAHVVFLLIVLHYLIAVFYFSNRNSIVPIPSNIRASAELCKILRARMGRPDFTFIDLGCGSGCVALAVAKEFPSAHVFGLDHNPEVLLAAKIKKSLRPWRYKNVRFIRADLWNSDVGALAPDVIYAYLGKRVAAKLGEKLSRELAPGTLVVSNKFRLPGLSQVGIVEFKTLLNGPLYIYKIPC